MRGFCRRRRGFGGNSPLVPPRGWSCRVEGRVGGPRGLRGRGGVVGGGCVGCEGCEGEGVAGVRVARTGDYEEGGCEEGGSCGGGVEMGRLVVDSGWGGDIIFCRRAALFGLVGGGVDQSKKPFQTRPARVTIVTTPLPSRKKTQAEQGNDERIASSRVTPGVCSNGNNRGNRWITFPHQLWKASNQGSKSLPSALRKQRKSPRILPRLSGRKTKMTTGTTPIPTARPPRNSLSQILGTSR